MCFRFLQVFWKFLKTGELPQHDHAHVDGLADGKAVPLDANPYGMDDNLHLRDTKQRDNARQDKP
jgi:C4-dicarboxylate transporter DctQ subunit